MQPDEIKPNVILQGPIFPEPVKVIAAIPMGDSIKIIGEGMQTGKIHVWFQKVVDKPGMKLRGDFRPHILPSQYSRKS